MKPVEQAAGSGRLEAQKRGDADGRRTGWRLGYQMGRVRAVEMTTAPAVMAPKPIRALFVRSGKGVPYAAIDDAIENALRPLVAELHTAVPRTALDAAGRLRPTLAIVADGMELPQADALAIAALGVRTAVWFMDDPYYSDVTAELAPSYQHVFTVEAAAEPFYRGLGCGSVHVLPLAADPRLFRYRHVKRAYRKEMCFIGSAFWNRVEFFRQLVPWLRRHDALISGWWWERLRHGGTLTGKVRPGRWMSPLVTAMYYAGSRVAVNMHRAHDDATFNRNARGIPALSVNPRTFEIAACATLQLTDERAGLAGMYEPGREIVTFSSPSDLTDKMNYYLEHEDERREIALAGLRRTLRDHTYTARLQSMLDTVLGT
jgi:spore maturation protein CgeB